MGRYPSAFLMIGCSINAVTYMWKLANIFLVMPLTCCADEDSSEDDSSDGGSHTEHTDDSMHTSDFETSQDESSDEEAAQHLVDQAPEVH